ncbi:hypothetical protein IP88_05755 [alpha proteobacterium AAP81b]|nr:hypothetical protein IP88_05755 [alpha proteobacterium AAP81b]
MAPRGAAGQQASACSPNLLTRLEAALVRLQSQLAQRDRELARLRAVEAVAIETLRDLDAMIDAESRQPGDTNAGAPCGIADATRPAAGTARRKLQS